MLGNAEFVVRLGQFFEEKKFQFPIVLDPIWRSTSGGIIATDDIRDAILEHLCRHLTVITPNVQELRWLAKVEKLKSQWIDESARMLLDAGCKGVLVKGGDMKGHPTDILFTKMQKVKFSAARLDGNVRGTGCHMATFLTGQLADEKPLEEAVRRSKNYVRKLFHNYSSAGNSILPAWRPPRPNRGSDVGK